MLLNNTNAHPNGPASEAEFDEYVAYAIEGRRRVKEQMNKRKPDDEFAKIDLSYVNRSGEEVVVYCPESKDAPATRQPTRRALRSDQPDNVEPKKVAALNGRIEGDAARLQDDTEEPAHALSEQHFTIFYGDTGRSYDAIFGPYLSGAKEVVIEDPYIRAHHQIQNFVRFCEMVAKSGTIKTVRLVTSFDDSTQRQDALGKLDDLKQSLIEVDIELNVTENRNIHDREVRLDNGWTIKIGRGLDFYQRPESWFELGATDLSLRRCLETKVDIFKR